MKYWRRNQVLILLLAFSLIGTAGCGRKSGTELNGRGTVLGKETAVPEEAGGRSTPVDSAGSELGTDISANDEDEITESDLKSNIRCIVRHRSQNFYS